MSHTTVLIADRDETRRAACMRVLQTEKGIRVVGRAPIGLEDLSSVADLKADILLLDLNLIKGKEIARFFVLRQISPQTRVLFLASRPRETRILEALSYGAHGYIEEKAIGTFLGKAVRCVAAGEAWVPRRMVAVIIERLARIKAWNLRERSLVPKSVRPKSN